MISVIAGAFDASSFALMAWRVHTSTLVSRKEGVVSIMYRDGTLYGGCLLVAHSAYLATYVLFEGERKVLLAPLAPA